MKPIRLFSHKFKSENAYSDAPHQIQKRSKKQNNLKKKISKFILEGAASKRYKSEMTIPKMCALPPIQNNSSGKGLRVQTHQIDKMSSSSKSIIPKTISTETRASPLLSVSSSLLIDKMQREELFNKASVRREFIRESRGNDSISRQLQAVRSLAQHARQSSYNHRYE